ncbi:MAG: HD domain-containing protein [Anaerolineales bacterium]|nr:HD domain-containing protein [Anaerolineales bacterium]
MPIHYRDPIYGSAEIDQPVLLDILQSKAMQRLHGVFQHGVSALVGITSPTTRFEHSVGALLLVRRLGAQLEEQIAALLHDVSHTAFSHVIDYVFNGHESQSYHDEKKAEYVSGTDLPTILAGHGYDWQIFLDESAYPLLEQPAPRLCADRLDYFLRDALDLGLATGAEIDAALDALQVCQERIVVTDLAVARWLGETFIAADQASWANFREVGLYELTARAIRRALKVGLLSEADLWGTDQPAWEKLQASSDPEIQYDLQRVHAGTQFVWDEVQPEFRVATKLRSIDPDVFLNGEVRPLSSLDAAFAALRRNYLAKHQGKWPMRVISAAD